MTSHVTYARAVCVALLGAAASGTAAAGTVPLTVSNSTPITINHVGNATPAVSEIVVDKLRGDVQDITVTLNGVSHTYPDDIEVLLVAPNGQKIKLMSDVGGATDLTGINIGFNARAASRLPDFAAITAGTYLPTDIVEGDSLPAPALAPPYSLDLTTLYGPSDSLNGTWQLFVADDASGDAGKIAGGWTLSITAAGFDSCAAEGYVGSQHALCRQICEVDRSRDQGLQGLLNAWNKQFGTRPPCMD